MRFSPLILLLVLILSSGPAVAASGLFEAPYRVVPSPYFSLVFASARVDADTSPDLVIAGSGGAASGCGELALWKSDMAGRILFDTSASAPCFPSGVAIADVDHDGSSEVIVAGRGVMPTHIVQEVQGGVRIYDSELHPTDLLTAGHFTKVAVGRLDADDLLDIVVGQFADTLAVVLHATGPTSFVPTTVPLCSNPVAIVLADLDADGNQDIVAGSGGNRRICIARGHADGSFDGPTFSNVNGVPSGLVVGSFTGDGILDVVSVSTGSGNDVLTVHVGTGTGSVSGRIETVIPGRGAVAIEALDFNHDGKLDVCVHEPAQDLFLPGNGDGSFGSPEPVAVPVSGLVPAADLDGDGVEERLGALKGNVVVRPFRLPTDPAVPEHSIPYPADAGTIADVDGDEWNDLVVVSELPLNAGVFLMHNDRGVLGPPERLGNSTAKAIRAADLDGDGFVDLAWVGLSGLTVRRGLPGHTFEVARTFDTPAEASDLELADLNGDRILDAVVATRSGSICTWLGSAASVFDLRIDYTVPGPASGVTVGDWNEDGILDLAVAIDGGSSIQPTFLGNGNGSFTAGAGIPLGGYQISVDAARFDGDEHEDLAFGSLVPNENLPSGGLVTFARGVGDGTFLPAFPISVSLMPSNLEFHDLDDDSDLDLVSGGTANVIVQGVPRPDAGYGPEGREAFGATTPMSRLVVGDLTGDGILDLVSYTDLLPGRTTPAGLEITVGSNGPSDPTPGGQVSTIAAVSNLSNHARQFIVAWDVHRGWPGTGSVDTLEVPAQGWAFDTLTVTIPDSAAAGRVSIGARAHVRGAPALSDSATAYFIVPLTGGIALAPIGANPGLVTPGVVLSAPSGTRVVVELLSVLGRVVERQTIPDTGGRPVAVRFDPKTPAGIYFVRALQGTQNATLRLVTVH
jgi:hypothetical protein